MSEFMTFERHQPAGRKTAVVLVKSKRSANLLGVIKWHGAWRQYVFWPEDECVFSEGCMEDINAQVRALMGERRAAEALKKMKALVAEGKVEMGNEAVDPERGVFDQRDTVVPVAFDNNKYGGVEFNWARRGVGFGQVVFAVSKADGKLSVDMEGMSDTFVLDVVGQALREAKRR